MTTDHPYTDDDLRAEAARQHATLIEDPDFMGVGEQMDDRFVHYEVVDAEHGDLMPPPGTPRWNDLSEDEFDEAQRKIHDLINGAADVSEWAVNLGADGLEPLPEQLSAQTDNGPWFRLHFAVRPDMPDHMRRALVEGVGAEIAKHFGEGAVTPAESTRRVQCGDCGAVGDVAAGEDGRRYLYPSGQIGH
ncbi:hypothetical protein ACFWMV_04660 [Streptomyces mutabilis]|uniref:hypothetical protein n=1 Tax=Streptomyces mutabilis TaxID=67332 RepID=UPI003653A322